MKNNIILATDAYKETHWRQYPENTRTVYSYLESRGGKYKDTVFFGLQVYLKKYLEGIVLAKEMIDEAQAFCAEVFGTDYFNRAGWDHILSQHGGRLPLRIKAVPEGTAVPIRNVLMTVENTDPKVPWLTNFMESLLLQACWYGTTVCTNSNHIKRLIQQYADQTGGSVGAFHLNDFGFRGVSSMESSGLGGAAHLVNFMGTDTLEAIRYAKEYYKAGPCGFSVMATEHSTTTIYGRKGEVLAYDNFLNICPKGIVSIVADSYDIYHAVKEIFGRTLREKVLARDGRVVIRPDSGHPPKMSVQCLEMLWEAFGGTSNEKGFKVLNPKVGVIYGDWMSYEMVDEVLMATTEAGYATCPENLVFGMGGALLQQVNRDTQKFAFKCCAADVGGEWRDVFKQPVTDSGKNSKKGRMKLVKVVGAHGFAYATAPEDHPMPDVMETVFEDGVIKKEYTFDEVKANAASAVKNASYFAKE